VILDAKLVYAVLALLTVLVLGLTACSSRPAATAEPEIAGAEAEVLQETPPATPTQAMPETTPETTPVASTPTQPDPTPSELTRLARSLPDLGAAPDFTNEVWINADAPLTLETLRGKMVLVEFWTFG
jgi:hypothetical protein